MAAVNGLVPVAALEYYYRPKGFGGQTYYMYAVQYIAYAHLAFWSTPMIAFATQLSQ